MKFLNEDSEFQRSTMQAVAAAAEEIQKQHDLDRATMIANAVAKMLGG